MSSAAFRYDWFAAMHASVAKDMWAAPPKIGVTPPGGGWPSIGGQETCPSCGPPMRIAQRAGRTPARRAK